MGPLGEGEPFGVSDKVDAATTFVGALWKLGTIRDDSPKANVLTACNPAVVRGKYRFLVYSSTTLNLANLIALTVHEISKVTGAKRFSAPGAISPDTVCVCIPTG